jgi:hypothetical protein
MPVEDDKVLIRVLDIPRRSLFVEGGSMAMSMARIALAAMLLQAAGSADAQQIRGRLVDLQTSRPIPGAVVTLLAADSSVVTTTMSGAEGDWQLDAPRPGVYYVTARRLGYRPWISAAGSVRAGAEWNPVFRLQALPVTLDPATARAVAARQHLELNGFFERQKGNFGHFITPEAIDRRDAARITDLLTPIPGVQLVASGDVGPAQIALRGSSLTDGALCRPRVFVDGLMYTRGDSRPVRVRGSDATERAADLERRMDQALSLDDVGHPSTIAAIEVYRSATQVPVQFGGTSVETLCGVIVIWTRTGRTPAKIR